MDETVNKINSNPYMGNLVGFESWGGKTSGLEFEEDSHSN